MPLVSAGVAGRAIKVGGIHVDVCMVLGGLGWAGRCRVVPWVRGGWYWDVTLSAATLKPQRSQVNYPPLGQIQLITGDLYIRRPHNFYPSSSCIFWSRLTNFWCPLRLQLSRSDNLIGVAGARALTKLAKYFLTIGFLINYTGRIIVIYMYHIICLHFLVDSDFLQVDIFIFIGFAVVLVYHGPQG